jgi:hypothetical protein
VVVRFSAEDHGRVSAAARKRGVSVAAFVRWASVAAVEVVEGPAVLEGGVVRKLGAAVAASGRPDAAAFQAMSARQALLRRRPSGGAD